MNETPLTAGQLARGEEHSCSPEDLGLTPNTYMHAGKHEYTHSNETIKPKTMNASLN